MPDMGSTSSTSEAPGDQVQAPAAALVRQAAIRDLIHSEGSITVDHLVKLLRVSRMTVHRDLDVLSAEGVLRKVRGGATARRSSLFESDLPFRMQAAREEKLAIARRAAALVEGGSAVMLDESTTALAALHAFDNALPVTVITNGLPAMQYVTSSTAHRLVGLGGDYVPNFQAFLGVVCERAITGVYADVLLSSCSAVRGLSLYHQDQRIVGTKQAMVRAAPVRVLLVDSSKLNVGAIYQMGHITDYTHMIIDDGAPSEFAEFVAEYGVEVIVAPVEREN